MGVKTLKGPQAVIVRVRVQRAWADTPAVIWFSRRHMQYVAHECAVDLCFITPPRRSSTAWKRDKQGDWVLETASSDVSVYPFEDKAW